MDNTRTHNSIKNIIYGIGLQILTLVFNFIGRTVFIRILGSEYLGINGLFTNVLTILSLAELGIGNAIIYSMYKPLAAGDKTKLTALMNFYKNIYRKIALLVFLLGICILPFIDIIVNTDTQIPNLKLYYLLFLANSLCSYFFIFKSSIINADQKTYIQKKYNCITIILQTVLQIIILLITHNFILYLIIQVLCTLLNNIMISRKADKMYPYINNKAELTKSERKEIYSNVNSMFIYKISGTILSNTDNILISILVGTIWVGYYSNYYMLINAIVGIVSIIFTSITASVGNLNTETKIEKQESVFLQLSFIAFFIYGIITTTLIVTMNDFITLWIGNQFVLNYCTSIIIIVNFYIVGILNPIWIYRDTTGLFKTTKTSSIILAVMNLVLSVIGGIFWGLFGILLATAISRLCISYWYQPYMLYKEIFKKSSKTYFVEQIKYVLVVVFVGIIVTLLVSNIHQVNMYTFIIKGIVGVLTSTIIFIIIFHKNENFRQLYKKFAEPLIKKVIKTK